MKLKNGASIKGLRPEMVLAASIVDDVYMDILGFGCTITEGTGGRHSRGSLHYVGLALDFRSRYTEGDCSQYPEDIKRKLAEAISSNLGPEFDTVIESNHIHLEFQPKK